MPVDSRVLDGLPRLLRDTIRNEWEECENRSIACSAFLCDCTKDGIRKWIKTAKPIGNFKDAHTLTIVDTRQVFALSELTAERLEKVRRSFYRRLRLANLPRLQMIGLWDFEIIEGTPLSCLVHLHALAWTPAHRGEVMSVLRKRFSWGNHAPVAAVVKRAWDVDGWLEYSTKSLAKLKYRPDGKSRNSRSVPPSRRVRVANAIANIPIQKQFMLIGFRRHGSEIKSLYHRNDRNHRYRSPKR